MRELKSKPRAFWRFDSASPFTDYSGYSQSATLTGTAVKGLSLTRDTSYSQYLNATRTVSLPSTVFQDPDTSWTMTLTIVPVLIDTLGNDVSIVSHASIYDGLLLNGTVLEFVEKFNGQPDAVCSYDFQLSRKLNVAVVHTSRKTTLFVDGVAVDEVELTPEQVSAGYQASGALGMGKSAGGNGFNVNSLAFFQADLAEQDIKEIHEHNIDIAPEKSAVYFSGEIIDVSRQYRIPWRSATWNKREDWDRGRKDFVTVDNDDIVPEMSNGLTVSGQWSTSYPFVTATGNATVSAGNLHWSGVNVVVETSIDNGVTWYTAVRGEPLASITSGMNLAGKTLQIRAKFTAGQQEAYMESLRLDIHASSSWAPNGGRPLTFTAPAVPMENIRPFDYNDRSGASLTGGQLTFVTNPNGFNDPLTVEVWVKKKPGGSITFGSGFTNNRINTFVNGSSATVSSIPEGQWAVVHFTYSTAPTASMTISGNNIIGRVVFYPTALTNAQANQAITGATGLVTTTQTASAPIVMSEPATPSNNFAFDWSR